MIKRANKKFQVLSMDITNYCNARCIFCFNQWDKLPERSNMTPETLRNIIPIFQLFEDGGVYFSCLFEPSIHPDFTVLLSLLPEEYKKKVFFTSNFIRPMTDEELGVMADANVDHINVSIETYDEGRYEYLLGGVKKSAIHDNLRRFASICKSRGVKKLRVVSMLLNSNYEEMPELVRRVHEELDPIEHEIRTPYFFEGDDKRLSVFESELLERARVDEMGEKIRALGYDNIIFDGTMDHESYVKRREEKGLTVQDNEMSDTDIYTIRIEPYGRGWFARDKVRFEINELDDPVAFFRQELVNTQKMECGLYLAPEHRHKEQEAEPMHSAVDEMVLYDDRFLYVRGWESFFAGNAPEGAKRLIIIKNAGKNHYFYPRSESRPDISKALGDERLSESGFHFYMDTESLDLSQDVLLLVGYETGGMFNKKIVMSPVGEGYFSLE